MIIQMRRDKCTHNKRGRVKIPLLPNNIGKIAGQQGHNKTVDVISLKLPFFAGIGDGVVKMTTFMIESNGRN